jgi:hypothetical protein
VCTRLAAASDKVYQLPAHGRWISPGNSASSTTQTGRHDIAEILLKGQVTGKLYHLRLRVECTRFCNLQSRARTHAVLVIGLFELLGNPTTQLIEPPAEILLKVALNIKIIDCCMHIHGVMSLFKRTANNKLVISVFSF